MDNSILILIGLIIVVVVVMVIVGFIGNKVVDGAGNAMRSKKIRQQKENPQYQQAESLAARFNQARPNQTRMPQQTAAAPAKFCNKCGRALNAGAVFCDGCGNKVEQ